MNTGITHMVRTLRTSHIQYAIRNYHREGFARTTGHISGRLKGSEQQGLRKYIDNPDQKKNKIQRQQPNTEMLNATWAAAAGCLQRRPPSAAGATRDRAHDARPVPQVD